MIIVRTSLKLNPKPRRGDIISPLRGSELDYFAYFYKDVIPTGLELNSPAL